MNRRHWMLGGAGAAAALAGIGWRYAATPRGEPAPASLWQTRLARPEGGELDLGSLRGSPLVLNFWATWCAPCIEEMPQLDRFHRDFASRGWQVVGLAIDAAPAVREFLLRTPVSFAIGLAQADGVSLARQLGNQAGGLPFSVVFNRDGRPIQRQVGKTSYQQLAAWAAGPL